MKRRTGTGAVTCAAALAVLWGAACKSHNAGPDDPCLSAVCDPLATCVAEGAGYQCVCPTGYDDVNGDGTSCVDTDECSDGLDDCDPIATCTNTAGGYFCACPAGYDDVNSDGTSCVDTDECTAGLDDCDPVATCHNTPGGFTCTCPVGYDDVHGDGTVCELVTCTAEGDTHGTNPGALDCCAGLVEIPDAYPAGGGICQTTSGSVVCANCGDGSCGLGENECNCPADCTNPTCTPEGQSHAVVPGALPCCAGLTDVGCDTYDAGAGQCVLCAGASYCTACGDGVCGLGENQCRCPADCPP